MKKGPAHSNIAVKNPLLGKSARLLESSAERYRFYIRALVADRDPSPSEGISEALTRFDCLMSTSAGGKPVVYSNGYSASLHFDMLSVQSEMNLTAPFRLTLGYTQTMMGFLFFHENPTSVAMIGLGGSSLVKYFHHHLPNVSIVVLEKNSDVIALRNQFLIPKDDERLSIRCMDGADFVKKHGRKYDVLMVDGFDQTGQPPQLCSQEFYDSFYQTLNEGASWLSI